MPNTLTAGALQEETESPHWPRRSAQRLSKSATWNNARLKMKTPPKMRDLAHRLLAFEAAADKNAEPVESAALRVYEKLRQSLCALAGVAAFESIAFRALTQAKSEAPGLWVVRIATDGSLQGLGEFEPQPDEFEPQLGTGKEQAGDGGIVLIDHILGLLLIFLGQAITINLLRNAWPGASFDDRKAGNGRES
jgi:hypothetical protein